MQISGGTSGLGTSDAAGLVTETESDLESNIAVAIIRHPVLLLDEYSDTADKV